MGSSYDSYSFLTVNFTAKFQREHRERGTVQFPEHLESNRVLGFESESESSK